MRHSTRILVNTAVTYGRMAATFAINIIITRQLLAVLGIEDFGLFSALGAGLAIVAVVNESLSASTQRHLAHAIGSGEPELASRYFNTALALFAGAATTFVVAGQLLAPMLESVMDIPAGRTDAAAWVLQLLTLKIGATILFAPYYAVFYTYQAFVIESVINILCALLTLAAVFVLPLIPIDRLVGYAVATTVILMIQHAVTATICAHRYAVARISPRSVDPAMIGDLCSFAGWASLGSLATTLRGQGATLVLNIFFGNAVNAGFAVAGQAVGYATQFSRAVLRSVQPAMTSLVAARRPQECQRLISFSCRAAAGGLLLFGGPLLMEPSQITRVWLGEPPPFAAKFLFFLFIALLVENSTSGFWMAMIACGRVRDLAIRTTPITLLPVPVAFGAFASGLAGPEFLGESILLSAVLAGCVRIAACRREVAFSPNEWVRQVGFPLFKIATVAVAATAVTQSILPESIGRLVVSTSVFAVVTVITAWKWLLLREERKHVRDLISRFFVA
jgi:O-antigen/teichoic acid export membrane protein